MTPFEVAVDNNNFVVAMAREERREEQAHHSDMCPLRRSAKSCIGDINSVGK